MPRLSKLVVASLTFVSLCFGSATMTRADELIINGGFETGTFSGWTVVRQPGSNNIGNFYVRSGNTTQTGQPTVGPASGTFHAVSSQGGPGAYSLLQTFVVSPGSSSVVLSFALFTNNYAGQISVNPAGLNFNAFPNQHARVDILSAGASPFDTGAGVLRNFFLGGNTTPGPNPYVNFSFDITNLVGSGGTFQLRFAEVDNQSFFHLGVDNVSINATSAAPIPEPTTMILLGTGLVGVVAKARRRRQNS